MTRDSHASYIHLRESYHAQYIKNWVHDSLPNEDIEAPGLHLDEDDDDNSTMQHTKFGSIKTQRKHKHPMWKDIDLHRFLTEETDRFHSDVQDNTILKRLDNLHAFESQESDQRAGGPSPHTSNQDVNHAQPLPTFELSTPHVTKNRIAQRNPQNYQTPIGRIMR